ncbi:zinc finger domain-containing protein [Prauserella cavernicola]|uniref:DNA-binding phage zinc finger domain-containing protein n=1 Tax=Prauserella cavernicola TaxID=2800127 RepID=A0A934QR96_9PSEU|nr:hypothetical protein [Prauserella cavernicola]MBK1785120.1 hypothetical protein [Prauserella cavernicola]
MTARKARGQAPTGMAPAALFWNGQAANADKAETRDNPRLRHCPWPPCGAGPNQPCTVQASRGRRRPMTGYHDARQPPRETP